MVLFCGSTTSAIYSFLGPRGPEGGGGRGRMALRDMKSRSLDFTTTFKCCGGPYRHVIDPPGLSMGQVMRAVQPASLRKPAKNSSSAVLCALLLRFCGCQRCRPGAFSPGLQGCFPPWARTALTMWRKLRRLQSYIKIEDCALSERRSLYSHFDNQAISHSDLYILSSSDKRQSQDQRRIWAIWNALVSNKFRIQGLEITLDNCMYPRALLPNVSNIKCLHADYTNLLSLKVYSI